MMRACSANTGEGTLWPVDAALRPEGKHGPLVRTIASHRAYYERWAKTWEFQALLKAWVSAGDLEVGQAYKDAIQPLVWDAAGRDHFVEDVQAMRRRVEQHVPGRRGGPAAQARAGRPARRRVQRPAAPARARAGRPVTAVRDHAGGVCRRSPRAATSAATTRLTLDEAYRLPARPRAPDPALPPAPHAPHARPASPTCAGSAGPSGCGTPPRRPWSPSRGVAVPRGPPHPRAALLPAAARRRRQARPQPRRA